MANQFYMERWPRPGVAQAYAEDYTGPYQQLGEKFFAWNFQKDPEAVIGHRLNIQRKG